MSNVGFSRQVALVNIVNLLEKGGIEETCSNPQTFSIIKSYTKIKPSSKSIQNLVSLKKSSPKSP